MVVTDRFDGAGSGIIFVDRNVSDLERDIIYVLDRRGIDRETGSELPTE
jgi:hypothetical protein